MSPETNTGWQKIGNIVPDMPPYFEHNGWPTPEEAEFWQLVRIDEILPLLRNQLPAYLSTDQAALASYSTSVLLSNERALVGNPERLAQTMADSTIFSPTTIELVVSGPLASVIKDEIGVSSIHRSINPNPEVYSDAVIQKIARLSPAKRALAWWGFWGDICSQYDFDQNSFSGPKHNVMSQEEGVNFLINTLHLNPPTIIHF